MSLPLDPKKTLEDLQKKLSSLHGFQSLEEFNKLSLEQKIGKLDKTAKEAIEVQKNLLIKYNVPSEKAIELAIDFVIIAKFITTPTDPLGFLYAVGAVIDIIKVASNKKDNKLS